ncbi:unnamed protein product [Bursaphelenchus xylophilus]|uniref:(pine wood nematode) hypothetical protein n=1 Tax=Bursaphelenchus xylophilus TaxID=6326 RepID=A0A1I7S4F7_BURXY|nr:unnamed protein product [Bursaphelenchus xylophilus]CAG9117044.1 unnamed protein product [Bursaphelenchus xylophilus]
MTNLQKRPNSSSAAFHSHNNGCRLQLIEAVWERGEEAETGLPEKLCAESGKQQEEWGRPAKSRQISAAAVLSVGLLATKRFSHRSGEYNQPAAVVLHSALTLC